MSDYLCSTSPLVLVCLCEGVHNVFSLHCQVREELVGHQRQVAVTQTRCGELQTEVQRSQQEVQAARKEHEEYKLRAAGILQVSGGDCCSMPSLSNLLTLHAYIPSTL